MVRTPEHTALLVALLLKRSELKRGRISGSTIRRLSKRTQLRRVFMGRLQEQLDDLGLILVELERGGYGVMASAALEGAPAITAKKYLKEDLERLKNQETNFDDIRDELSGDLVSDEEDE
jgi:hypothetical protein